ncbi:FAD-dependent thymidylate synthase [Arthrospira platensis SPKY2]
MKLLKVKNENKTVLSINGEPEEITGVLARYSRSLRSIEEIIAEFNNKDNNKLVKKIVDDYGHSSIINMGYLSCCIEGISFLGLLNIFNRCPLQGGQERSTRYINLNRTKNLINNISDNKEKINNNIQPLYEKVKGSDHIYKYWYLKYEELNKFTFNYLEQEFKVNSKDEKTSCKLRTLDCIRYLLPMGTLTQGGLIQSGREWSKLIRYLKNKGTQEEIIITNLLEEVLTKYDNSIGKNLIRHIDNKDNIKEEDIKNILKNYKELFIEEDLEKDDDIRLISNKNIEINKLINIYYPDVIKIKKGNNLRSKLEKEIIEYIIKTSDHKFELDTEFRSIGNYNFIGKIDLGTLTDLNRHRGCFFIPFLDKNYTNIKIKKGKDNTYRHLYSLPYYLEIEKLKKLKNKYIETFEEGFKLIENSIKTNKLEGQEIKYLLPKAYRVKYYLSLDINRIIYILSLRGKETGHLGYRMFSY